MHAVDIQYIIKLKDNTEEHFDYSLDGETFEIEENLNAENLPKWTELGFKQCSICPLNAEEHKHCPVAVQLHGIVERFHKTRSIDEVELHVVTEERTMIKTTALQNAISSLLGLVFPICGCPKTAGMKPLARFHVPMASEEETVFRVASMYLMAQYFINNNGQQGTFDFTGLVNIYDDLHILNKAVASRLQHVTKSDSVKNAITLLDMYSSLVPALLQDQLVEIRGFFTSFLPKDGVQQAPARHYLEQAKAFKLELIPTEEEAQDKKADLPDWLRKTIDEEPVAKVEEEVKAAAPSPVFSEFVMSLTLEPIEGEAAPAAAGEKKRAVFTLPDDDIKKS
jgi:hypothetical protein